MKKVTALTTQKRNKNRVNVYLDGEFAFGLPAIVAARLSLGQLLSEADIARLQKENALETAKEQALRYLTYRPRSRTELRRYLQQKGHEPETITAVLDRLTDLNLIDDKAFARYWVEQRETFRPRSKIALQQELMAKGVSREAIEAAIETVDELDAARKAAQKQLYRWRNLPEQAFKTKLGQFLQRRGFGYEIILEIIDELWQATNTKSDT
ncbi:MAG: regulatory protein RecX [Chloroflexi bacterium]|nr:MAG: regulatory protein RecX [Chloroflexota bacterium]